MCILWYFMQISTEMNRNESNIVINQFLLPVSLFQYGHFSAHPPMRPPIQPSA